MNDPDMCNPFATSLWELSLMQTHYHPYVTSIVDIVSQTKKLHRQRHGISLNIDLLSYRPQDLFTRFAMFQEDGFTLNPSVQVPPAIIASMKRLKTSKMNKIDGPTSWTKSQFLTDIIKMTE